MSKHVSTWQQLAMSLSEPVQAPLAPFTEPAHTQASKVAKAENEPLNGSNGSLSLTERLERRSLKFQQLHARANVHWQRFWASQILHVQAQLGQLDANDLDLGDKLRHRQVEYEAKLASAPWLTPLLKEIENQLKALDGAK